MIGYLAAALLLFGRPLWHGGARVPVHRDDEGIFAWGFAWWPHALWHGLNPFYSHLLYAPRGFDLALSTMVPGVVFVVPAIAHLAILAFANEISCRRFVALLVVALVLQFSFSPEVLVSLTLFGFAAVAIGYALGDPGARAALRGLLAPVALAYLLTAVLVSPYLYYAFQPGKLPILLGRTNMFSNDLLGFAVPTQLTALGGLDSCRPAGRSAPVSSRAAPISPCP